MVPHHNNKVLTQFFKIINCIKQIVKHNTVRSIVHCPALKFRRNYMNSEGRLSYL
jgi:hypothetical protein